MTMRGWWPIVCILLAGALRVGGDDAPAATNSFICDLVLDSGTAEVAAWQVELRYDRSQVSIREITGGDVTAFPVGTPPYFDTAGLTAGRIVLAAFSTLTDGLPKGSFRVARLRVDCAAATTPIFAAKVATAAGPGGKTIPVTVTVRSAAADSRPAVP